ncbi:MAG: TetR/AcrR family transcriptional regulator [Paucimonas sp.]|jgi:AcrR family transcriptional regulator|nr:TetR/AcrR family transcriptional regulator [Paucimonas sp.]
MECSNKKGTRWARRKEARPQELLSAALDLFVERGYAATRLEDVAARAGVSKGTLYLYFENKEDLFKAVVRENMVTAIGNAEQQVESFRGNSADLFRAVIKGWWQNIGSTKASGITKLMMAESGNFPEVATFYYEEVIARVNAMLIRILDRGMQSGEFRRMDCTEAMNVVIAPMIMLMMWKHSFTVCRRETIDPDSYLDCYCNMMLNGLLAEPDAAKATQPKSKS